MTRARTLGLENSEPRTRPQGPVVPTPSSVGSQPQVSRMWLWAGPLRHRQRGATWSRATAKERLVPGVGARTWGAWVGPGLGLGPPRPPPPGLSVTHLELQPGRALRAPSQLPPGKGRACLAWEVDREPVLPQRLPPPFSPGSPARPLPGTAPSRHQLSRAASGWAFLSPKAGGAPGFPHCVTPTQVTGGCDVWGRHGNKVGAGHLGMEQDYGSHPAGGGP